MLNNIILQAFKSFRDKENIPLSRLTVITGINSSGKSSIIQAIRILEKLIQTENLSHSIPEGHGGIKEILNDASSQDDFLLGCKVEDGEFSFTKSANRIGNPRMPPSIFISADRFGPRPAIKIKDNAEVDSNGENLLHFLDTINDIILPDNVQHPKAEKKTLLANVSAWINEISPGSSFKYVLEEKADTSFTLFNDHRANNVGFGLSYTLPIIVTLLAASIEGRRKLVMLENPEAHLHPKGQSKIAELICKVASSGTQVILETHSDHIINGIRVSCLRYEKGENGINRSEVGILHVFQDLIDFNGPSSHIIPVTIEEGGRIFDAPEDFFDQYNIDRKELLGF